ncbi:hypothetical protein Cch02nite_65290 [Catellatospora chokoriensis]|uniref:Uncharacterized protein n=2 Tax=Catellatospora chokoriensis TaxID=310353 RepID=A0A8J3NUJ8_9ACTN|nr:hypothetical protein Cch02nite_65290 [Catellatospora chokoriensis]
MVGDLLFIDLREEVSRPWRVSQQVIAAAQACPHEQTEYRGAPQARLWNGIPSGKADSGLWYRRPRTGHTYVTCRDIVAVGSLYTPNWSLTVA